MKMRACAALGIGLLLSYLLVGCNSADTPKDTTAATTQEETVKEEITEAMTEPQTAPETEADTHAVTDADTEPVTEPVTEPDTEEETRVTVDEVISRSVSKVNIVAGDTPTEQYAAAELTEYLTRMGVTVGNDGYRITITVDPSMGDDDYHMAVQRKNGDGTVITGGKRGILYAAYRFLEEFGGARFFTPTLEVIPANKLTITTGVIEYSPVFVKRSFDWWPNRASQDWMVKNGINDCGWYGSFDESVGGNWDSSVLSAHTMGVITGTGNGSSPNPCLTDPQNLANAIAYVRRVLKENPGLTGVSVSQNDNNAYCQCEKCAAIDAEEGSPAGTLLRFVNAVAADIAEDYPNVVVDTFAYMYTQTAPKITKPLPNVAIRLCSIRCHFTHPISDNECERTATFNHDLQEWSKICDNIYIWDYTTNYRYFIPTFANFKVIRENMIYFADHNVKGMFPEGNYSSTSGEFGELRAYLLAKLMMDPYMSEREYSAHMDEFLQAYYGEGWQYIRAYIDATCAKAAGGCQSIYDEPFKAIGESYYRAMEVAFEDWWSKAEELAGDRVDAVKRSRLQWRYIKLMLHPNEEEARQFVADVTAAGIAWGEGDLHRLPDDVDFSKPPHEWFTFTWWL